MSEKISNTKKTIKGLSTQTIITLSMGVTEIVAFSILSRLLTKIDFGYFAAITAITSVLIIFSEAGVGAAIIQRKDLDKRFIDNAFTLSLILGLVISSMLFVCSDVFSHIFIDDTMSTPLRLISITILLHSLTSVNLSLMHRELHFFKVGIIRLSSLLTTNVIAIVLAYNGWGYYSIIVKAVLDSVISYILSAICVKMNFCLYLNKQISKEIFSFSGWLSASAIFRNISHQVDKLLMPQLLSVATLGAYNRPKEFINHISGRINSIFDVVLFPVLSSINGNILSLQNSLKKSMYYVNILSALLFLGFVVNTELLIRIFFGEEWLNLTSVFQLLTVAVLFNVNGRLADCYLRSMGMTKDQFCFRIVETLLSLAGVIIGSHWGMIGVALAIVISDSSMKLIKIGYVANKIEINCLYLFASLLRSWRFMFLEAPIMLWLYLMFPNNVTGNIFLFISFLVINAIVFLFVPQIVGGKYYSEAYIKVKGIIINKVLYHA